MKISGVGGGETTSFHHPHLLPSHTACFLLPGKSGWVERKMDFKNAILLSGSGEALDFILSLIGGCLVGLDATWIGLSYFEVTPNYSPPGRRSSREVKQVYINASR